MKLYIITNSNFMADFIFDEFKDDTDVVLIQFKERKNPFITILKWIRLKLGNPRGMFDNLLFHKKFLLDLSHIHPEDKILLWSIENLKITLLMAREINSTNIMSFLWNPMFRLRRNRKHAEIYRRTLNEYGIELSTFDRYDSKMLNCKLMPQVHRAINMPKIEKIERLPFTTPRCLRPAVLHVPRQPDIRLAPCHGTTPLPQFDVFFVGQLKGREITLSKLIKEFKDNKITYHFHLVYGNHYKNEIDNELKGCIGDRLMTYKDTLDKINRSRCLLDLTQKGQKGLTLRPIEALIYKKKLITDNIAIKEEAFYNSNNIWIIGDSDEKRSIVDFLNNIPYVPIPYELEQHYHIRKWLDELWENRDDNRWRKR